MALFFTYALPLLLPTVIYLLWRLMSPPRSVAKTDHGATMTAEVTGGAVAPAPSGDPLWREAPWLWLALAGVVLLAIVLLFGAFVHGSPPQVKYVPPRLENGQIVPGELRPAESGEQRSGAAPGGAR